MGEIVSQLRSLAEKFRPLQTSDPDLAFALAKQGAALAAEHGELQWQVNFMIDMTETKTIYGHISEGMEILAQAIPLAKELNDPLILAKVYGIHANTALETNRTDGVALEELLLAHTYATHSGNDHVRSWTARSLMDTYRSTKNLSESFRYAEEVLSLKGVRPETKARTLIYMSEFFLRVRDFATASNYVEQAYELTKNSGDVNGIGNAICHQGYIQFLLKNYPAAIEKYQSVIDDNRGTSVKFAHLGLAQLYLDLEKFEDADRHADACLSIRTNWAGDMGAKLAKGRSAFGRGLISESITQLTELEKHIEVYPNEHQAKLYDTLEHAYEGQGDWQKANEYLRKKFDVETRSNDEIFRQQLLLFNRHVSIEREREKAEKQRLRAEQLEQDLASKMLQLSSQAEMLSTLRSDLIKLLHESNVPHSAATKVYNRLKTLPCQSVDWKKFDLQFKAAHPEFVEKLLTKHAGLSAGDVRLCSLVRMQMKSEEIARLFCVSSRTVETHRFRLRKKLRLDRGEDLTVYLAKLAGN